MLIYMDLERLFVITNPLYWVAYVLMTIAAIVADLIGRIRGFVVDYLFMKNKMEGLTKEELKNCIEWSDSTKWHKKWTDRKIREKAEKLLNS